MDRREGVKMTVYKRIDYDEDGNKTETIYNPLAPLESLKKAAEWHIENITSKDKYIQEAYQLGQRHIIDIIDRTIEEAGK
jgi:hypothetical protein